MIEKTYRCDLCLDTLTVEDAIGLYWVLYGWEGRDPRNTEHHLCANCFSSIQAMPPLPEKHK